MPPERRDWCLAHSADRVIALIPLWRFILLMKCALVLSCWFLAGCLGAGYQTAAASTISFASGDGVGEFNSLTGTNVLINVNSAWQPNGVGKWISYADTGSPGTVSPPNTSLSAPTAVFYEKFKLGDGPHTAHFSVWADDTAFVSINGFSLAPPPNPSQGPACAAGPISCTPNNGFDFQITDADGLKSGENTLAIAAYQRGGGPFGVLYQGEATSQSQIPEPASALPLGCVLTSIGLWRMKRRSVASRG
jgi:hypothetical protein